GDTLQARAVAHERELAAPGAGIALVALDPRLAHLDQTELPDRQALDDRRPGAAGVRGLVAVRPRTLEQRVGPRQLPLRERHGFDDRRRSVVLLVAVAEVVEDLLFGALAGRRAAEIVLGDLGEVVA